MVILNLAQTSLLYSGLFASKGLTLQNSVNGFNSKQYIYTSAAKYTSLYSAVAWKEIKKQIEAHCN